MNETVWECVACGRRVRAHRAKCQGCGAVGGFVAVEGSARRGESRALVRAGDRPVRASELPDEALARRSTGISALDELLGGGAVVPSVWVVGGPPGAGKSTVLARVASEVAGRRDALFVSAEMPAAMARAAAERSGARLERLLIWETDDLAAVEAWVRKSRARPGAIVLDSLPRLEVGGARATEAAQEAAIAVAVKLARLCSACVMCIAHATKEERIAGPRAVEHDGDVVLWLTRERWHSEKNRYAPSGVSVEATAIENMRPGPPPGG